jgi:hypothetical protein
MTHGLELPHTANQLEAAHMFAISHVDAENLGVEGLEG